MALFNKRSKTDGEPEEQTLISHLIELRSRLVRSVITLLVVFAGLSFFASEIYHMVSAPLLEKLPENSYMIATEMASPFLTPFKLTAFVALIVCMPYILFQAWSFVAPGLYENEKHFAIPLLASSILLFYLGILFAFFVVFPLVFGFLTHAAPDGVTVMPDINQYLSFILLLFFAFGMCFEVPVATLLLVKAGITTVEDLANNRPYIIVGAFVLGMLLTPPDIISQTLLAIPMWALFEIGLIMCKFLVPEDIEEDASTNGTN